MSFKIIFHLSIATQRTPNFTSRLALQMKRITQMLLLLSSFEFRSSGIGCIKLLLNEDKTAFLLIGTKQQLAKVNISHVIVGEASIAPQSPVKNLGVWLDSNLSMVDHITKTSSAAFYHLYNIRRIRIFLTKECTEILIHAFISNRLDYCNSLLGVPERHLHKLQRVQNAAARLIFQESRYCHIKPLLKSLAAC